MAWLAVNDSGVEAVYENKPCRNDENGYFSPVNGHYVTIPRGSIQKLIGRELTWDDEPVEI